jgi:hypothetical protein
VVPSLSGTSITIFPVFPSVFVFEDAEGFVQEIWTTFLRITFLLQLRKVLTIEDATPDPPDPQFYSLSLLSSDLLSEKGVCIIIFLYADRFPIANEERWSGDSLLRGKAV